MPGNSTGVLFKITTFGESHGKAIGVIIDGCPAGLYIDEEFIQVKLDQRRPGQSDITTQRNEDEGFEIMSGVFEGFATGTPIMILIPNKDARSEDYKHLEHTYRPSHADYTYQAKYGIRDHRGGGRSSARETAARVAAGAIAMLFLKHHGISIQAYVKRVGKIVVPGSYETLNLSETYDSKVKCPDAFVAKQMEEYIQEIKQDGDSVGGIIECIVKGVLPGLGDPVFDKLHADLGKAILSINACKGFETGSGFDSVDYKGSELNDVFDTDDSGKIITTSNNSGGIQGGISNGMDIVFRAVFKPVSTILKDQDTITDEGENTILSFKGRHDPCVLPRAVPIVEAMAALVIADHFLRACNVKL
ncbi:MAG TPA: chorismate synthase [Saprospiraceae bacterium]|nr:chorismate synthase [Saprospiraceae bacterium]